MCGSMEERIRINQILNDAVMTYSGDPSIGPDELTQFLFGALQTHYHGLCVDECLETTARDFALRHLAKLPRANPPSKLRVPAAA